MYTCRSTSILSKLFNKLLSTLSPHLWREEGEGERGERVKMIRVREEEMEGKKGGSRGEGE